MSGERIDRNDATVAERRDAALEVQNAWHRAKVDARRTVPRFREQRCKLCRAVPVRALRHADEKMFARVADVAPVERARRLDRDRVDAQRSRAPRRSPSTSPARLGAPGRASTLQRAESTAVSSTNVASGCAGSAGNRVSVQTACDASASQYRACCSSASAKSGVPSETDVSPSAKFELGGRTIARVKRNDITNSRLRASDRRSRHDPRWSDGHRRRASTTARCSWPAA